MNTKKAVAKKPAENQAEKVTSFEQLGLSKEILQAISKKGFTTPSQIQSGVIPLLLKGKKDIIGQAQTGTGKTAAFALPLLEKLDINLKKTQAIILAPTRELAIQVAKEIESFGTKKTPSVQVVYGGNSMRNEINALKKKPNIVVGTPGRMQHHIRRKNLNLEDVTYFVLDEADEMLNFGFREEIEEILKMTPANRRVLLFSATMPQSILNIVDKYMKEYDMVKVKAKEMTNENINQKYYLISPKDKLEALCRIMEDVENFYGIVFCRTKSDTDVLANQLIVKHLKAEAIHGDIDQNQREKILNRFREGKINILVATDVAARGIDVNNLTHVVNYSLPESFELYAHRIGRTGRAGNKGTALTFISRNEESRLKFFERNLKVQLEKGKLPEPKILITKKKLHLIERLEHIVNNEDIKHLIDFAKELLEEGKAEEVIAALIKESYKDDFNLEKYHIIKEDEGGFKKSSGARNSNRRSGRGNNQRNRRGNRNFSNNKDYSKRSSARRGKSR